MSGMNLALDAKERRYREKVSLCEASRRPLISVELNIPYPERTKKRYAAVFAAACAALLEALSEEGVAPLERRDLSGPDRKSAVFLTDAKASHLKDLCVRIEETHPWGRIFDLDVLDEKGTPVKRALCGKEGRTCFVCGENALFCILGQRHEKGEVMAAIHHILRGGGEG